MTVNDGAGPAAAGGVWSGYDHENDPEAVPLVQVDAADNGVALGSPLPGLPDDAASAATALEAFAPAFVTFFAAAALTASCSSRAAFAEAAVAANAS